MNKDKFEENGIKYFLDKYLDVDMKDVNNFNVLDYGCGNGRMLHYLLKNSRKYFKNMHYIGLDLNPNVIKEVKECFPFQSFNTVENFNFDNYKYDCIIFSHVLEHIERFEMINLFNMLYSKLKYGGYILLFTPYNNRKEFYTDFDHMITVYCETIENISKTFHNSELKLKYKKIRYISKQIEYQNGIFENIDRKIGNVLYKLIPTEKASQFGIFKKEKRI